VYAFSIDNFKRPQEEVDALMSLAEKALLELCSHGYVASSINIRSPRSGVENQPTNQTNQTSRRRGVLAEHGVRLNTIGKTQLFPPAVQAALAEAKELTKNNNR
jgi:ditrans,polycis-polyprenyl diphosphate synthase